MTLAELNRHLELVQDLKSTQELLNGLWAAAVPGAQKLTGMPHQPGVSDKTGAYAIEIADAEEQIELIKARIAESEAVILPWIAAIDDNLTRIVFRLRFIRGKQWQEVADIIGGKNTGDAIRMVCYRYLEDCPHEP